MWLSRRERSLYHKKLLMVISRSGYSKSFLLKVQTESGSRIFSSTSFSPQATKKNVRNRKIKYLEFNII